MDVIETAYAFRARAALDMLTEGAATSHERKAAAFVEAALQIAKARDPMDAMFALQRSKVEAVAKAAGHGTLDAVWGDSGMEELARSFIASIGEPDLLTAIAKYANVLTKATSRVLVASGSTGDTTSEGLPKVVRRLDLTNGPDMVYSKSVALCVVSNELLSATGAAGRALFEAELGKALVRACNVAALAVLIDTSTTHVTAGSNPLESLRAGLLAAGASSGYVVSAPASWVAWLATTAENRGGMSVRGGAFSPGIEIIAMDNETTMTVIPAGRLAIFEGGTELRPAGHATVDMADNPTAPYTPTSLWQTNAYGLLVERHWRIEGDADGVVVVG